MAAFVLVVECLYSAVMHPLHTELLNYIMCLQHSAFFESWACCVMFFKKCFFILRFQSERESGDRNFAIGYYLKEKKVDLFCLLYFGDCVVGFFPSL